MRRQVAWWLTLAVLASGLITVPPAPPAQAATINAIGSVYAGMYSEHFEAGDDLDALAKATGKRMTFGGTFHSVTENDTARGDWSNTREILDEVWAGRATPFANLTIPASAGSIAGGAWDAKINEWASHLEQFLNRGGGRSLVLAPLQEMNGNWTPYGCDPADFVDAYRRVVDIIRGRGIDETQVRFAFAPNGWTPNGCGSIESYYPSNAYVDVIGVSAYRWGDGAGVYEVMGGAVDKLARSFPGKPIVIAQTGAWPSDSKDQWISQMMSWAASDPAVVAVVYFNIDHLRIAGETDWRVWIPPVVNWGWRDSVRASTTKYQWPLRDWFQPGGLQVEVKSGVILCQGNADCDTVGFQDADGLFQIWTEATTQAVSLSYHFGNPGDLPFFGDWDCDGVETPGLYRQSDGFVYLRSSNTTGVADVSFFFGNPGDIPLAGDFDGDGCDTVSIYRPGQQRIYVINQLGSRSGGLGRADFSFQFGNPGDKPFVGDFNGDGIDTVGLHRESTGLVYLRNSNSTGKAHGQFIFGDPGDLITAGDWDGDGDDTVGAYRPSTGVLFLRNANTAGNANAWAPAGSYTGIGAVDR